MIDFKGLILAACVVTALGLNTNRQVIFADGFFCTPICKNRPDITGRTAKCLITHDEKVHSTLVRNPGYGNWVFYTVDNIDHDEDELCEEVVAGDAFLHNHTDTVCPSSVQYAKYYGTTADTSNDTEEMKTLIDKLDVAVNKVFRNTGVTTRRFAHINKRASAVARKVVETMNYLKQEVGLIDFGGIDTTSTEHPPHENESGEEPLDDEEEYNNDKEMSKRQDSKDEYKSTGNDATELVKTLVTMVNDLAKAVENKNITQSKRRNNKEKDSDGLKKDDSPTPPPDVKHRNNNSSRRKKKGLSYVLPPTSPPYNPNDYSEEGDDYTRRKRKGLSYVLPPTSPPYNPNDYSNQDDDHTTQKKRGFSYNLPPTSPPYNPPGFMHRHILQDYDEENDWPTLPTVPEQRRYDTSKCNNGGSGYILPPTPPPYNPNDYRHEQAPEDNDEGDSPNPHSTPKGGETSTNPPSTTPPHSVSARKRSNDDHDLIRNIREALKELSNEYKRSDSENLKEIVENLYEEVTQIEKTKKRSGTQPESAYPLLLSPIVEAVAESIDSVKRNSQGNDDEDGSLTAQYHPVDFHSMDALCGLMTTQVCEKIKLLHCMKDKTCCWAYIRASTCNEDFEDCYSALSTILKTLMY